MIPSLIAIISVLLIVNFYGYYGLRKLYAVRQINRYRSQISLLYWVVDIGFIVFSLTWALVIRTSDWPDYVMYRNYFYISGAFMLIYLPRLVFLIFILLHDIIHIFLMLANFIKNKSFKPVSATWHSKRLPQTGLILSVMMFVWVFHSIAFGRFDFIIREVKVEVEGLPAEFENFRIIHISDTHLGSFKRIKPVMRAVDMIRETQHDILVFTGDMINNDPAEASRFIQMFYNINSPDGKFSVLGNHDMGDYRRWHLIEERQPDINKLVGVQQAMGFKVLRNQHHFISRGYDSLMIAGVDNWGLPPFKQLGNLDKALGQNHMYPFIILLSHDPSHWREEVIPRTNISLTLSGHTHGLQAGIVTPWFQWSPISVKYPEWGGLYTYQNQNLHVNRGLGFLGFPLRMGMRPEITVISLVTKKETKYLN